MSAGRPVVEAVLAAPTLPERLAAVRGMGLDQHAGIEGLLDAAAELAAGDPRRGRDLAQVCVAAAATGPATTDLVPRAQYLLAQATARDGRLEEAVELIETARRGWAEQGDQLGALRTAVGRMNVLNALGRHDDALATGKEVLAQLDRIDSSGPLPVPDARTELRAMVHQNLGTTHGHTGTWTELIAETRTARLLFDRLGYADRTAALDENLGIALGQLGRVDEALEVLARAVAVFRREGDTLAHGRCLIESGRARVLRGEYGIALDVFDEAADVLDPLGPLPDRDWLTVSRADAHLALGLFDAADAGYGDAETAFRAAGLDHDLAHTLTGRGAALVQAARPAEAEWLLDEAARLWQAAGNAPMLSATLLELADLRDRADDRAAARALTGRSLAVLDGDRWPVEEFHARLRMSDLLQPDLDAALGELDAAQRLPDALRLPQLRYRLDERLGVLRLRQGRAEEGVRLLERAAAAVEEMRGALPRESMRASFLRDRVGAHTALVGHWLDRGDAESLGRAFEVAERVKSRSLVDLMRGSVSARIASADEDPLVRRLRGLQAELDAVYGSLLAGDADEPPGSRRSRAGLLGERAEELERQIDRLRLEIPVEEPGVEHRGPVLPMLRSSVSPGVTVLAYHVTGHEVAVFVEFGGRLSVARSISTVPRVELLLDRLSAQWMRFRAGAGLAGRHADRLQVSTQRVLAELYDELVRPVEALLDRGRHAGPVRLAVVPHGVLHRVPFHALHDGTGHLLERAELSYAPSATALALMRPPEVRSGPALVMGVPAPDIPAVRDEVTAVAAALPGATVHLGEHATVDALRAAAPGAGVVHLACHGLFRPENPTFSAVQLHDRWLTAADAMTLDLQGALVTLSACESGAGRAAGGGDEVIGLTRAFLGAGASAVLVSMWLAEDAPTAELMAAVYRGLRRGLAGPSALRATQLDLATRHPHPYHWAPFVYVGRPSTHQEEQP